MQRLLSLKFNKLRNAQAQVSYFNYRRVQLELYAYKPIKPVRT